MKKVKLLGKIVNICTIAISSSILASTLFSCSLEIKPDPELPSDSNIWAVINSNKYACDIESICSEDETKQIILRDENNQIYQEINRDEFNYPIIVGNGVSHIPDNFLACCINFNSSITFEQDSNLSYIGDSFLGCCESFNQPITLPASLRCISKNFLGDCYVFNQSVILPNKIQIIGQDFMSSCLAFNQDFTLTENILQLGINCMIRCNSFTSHLTINCPASSIDVGESYSWSTDDADAPIYTSGFTMSSPSIETENYFLQHFPTIGDASAGKYRQIKE